MHLAQEPVVLTVTAPAHEQVDLQMLDPSSVSFFKCHEEVVQAEIVTEHEHTLLFCSLDDWLDFGEDLAADAEDAIIAMYVR